MEKRTAIAKYFQPFPLWAAGMVILGLVLVRFMTANAVVGIIGMLTCGLGAYVIYRWSGRPTDSQMDAWTAQSVASIATLAIEKHNIDRSQLDIADAVIAVSPNPVHWPSAARESRRGKDGKRRFRTLDVSVVNCTTNQLLLFHCIIDLATDARRGEIASEHYYNDVVSLATETKPDPGGTAAVYLIVKLAGQRALRVCMGTSSNETEASIKAIHKMVREKKGGAMV